MIKKIRLFLKRIRLRLEYNRCYSRMEGTGIAVFGMCAGCLDEYWQRKVCLRCPYFTPIRKGEGE